MESSPGNKDNRGSVITSNASCGGIGSPYMRIQSPIRIKLHRECGWARSWGSGSHSRFASRIGLSFEELSEVGTELAVEDSTADLEQEIGTAAGPPHLL